MTASQPFELIYDAEIARHLASIERRYFRLIERTIVQQLKFEPDAETRNRKPLVRPSTFGADWELRFGPSNRFRVFYRVDAEAHEVHILAIGIKLGNRLLIGGEEFEL